MAAVSPLNEHKTRSSFKSPKVKENDITRRIIDAIFPYYPKAITCIGGWLSQEDAIWKINWHWESLIYVIDIATGMGSLSEKHQKCFSAIRSVLMSNTPNPKTGYRKINKLGDPKDLSSFDTVMARCRILRQSKRDVKSVVRKAGIEQDLSSKTGGLSVLVVQNVLPPKKTNHRTGWALDIKGRANKVDNKDIVRISKALGATLTYDEAFHVHVEFENGVKVKGFAAPVSAPDPRPKSEVPEPPEDTAARRESAWWEPGELLRTTGKGWAKIFEDFF